MKYTIEGFSQIEAIKLGIDGLDLIILRWLVDFIESGNMRTITLDGEKYYWVHHKRMSEELPILNMQKNAIYRRLKKFCDAKILKKKIVHFGSTYTYYTLGENYINLVEYKYINHS